MDIYERNLVEQAVNLLARVIGHSDSVKNFVPILTFVKNKNEVHSEKFSNHDEKENFNRMLVELKIKYSAKKRKNGLFEITPTVDGKRLSIYGRTPDEIAEKYKKIIKSHLNAKKVEKNGISLYEWFDEWLDVYKKPNVSKSTYLNIKRCITKHIESNLTNKPIESYTLSELTEALNKIPSTRMRKYARDVLRQSMNFAVQAGKIANSPATNLLPVKHTAIRGKSFPLLDLLNLIKNSQDKLPREYWLYYLFCLFSGTRRDEALNIRRKDLDFRNKIIHIPGTKTDTSDRMFPMSPILEKIIGCLNGKDKIFPNVSSQLADKKFHIFRGNFDGAVLHWLRHTFGTIQICANQIPTNTVSKWLGHSDPATTIRIYTHPEDLAPDIYYSGLYSESEKIAILQERYNKIISFVENTLNLPH